MTKAADDGSGYSAFAKSAMAKMGWTEGTGLGKNSDGISTHVSVKKRVESVGLGHDEQLGVVKGSGKASFDADGHWWNDAFGDALARVNKKKKKATTLDEIFEKTGGARLGMRARRQQKGKHKRETERERKESKKKRRRKDLVSSE